MERRLAAILIADVAGYSRLSHLDEEGTRTRFLADLTEVFEPKIEEHHGRLVKTMGDGLLVEFSSVVNALRCAIDVQQAAAKKGAGVPTEQQLRFRIGINLGDVIAEGEDVHGDGVNIADRLQNLADPGGIAISGTAYDQVKNKLNIGFENLGELRVKNIDEPLRAYRVGLNSSSTKRWIPTRSIRQHAIGLAASGFLAVAAVVVLWLWYGSGQPAVATPSVAVLPFENLSGDPANGRLADGITEDVITDLSRYSEFTVIARNSTEVYRGKPVDVRQIGKDLNVRYVLEGSFQRQADQVRITAQLIDTATGIHLWSERYDRPVGEVFAIQSEVADRIANSLGGSAGHVFGSSLTAAKRKRPGDLGAYELYLLGRDKMINGLTLENQLEAKKLLEQALQMDPTLARAQGVLAWTYAWRATQESDTAKLAQEMLKVAQRAVELDPMDADSHQGLGYALGMNGDLKQADIEFDKALRLNPNAFDILADYACWAHSFGKAQAGADAVDRAVRLNPTYPMWAVDCFRMGLVMVGRYEDILRNQAHQPEEKWNQDGYVITAGSLAALGRLDEAKALVARGTTKFPGLLSIEKFTLNRGWSADAIPVLNDLMRKGRFSDLCK